MAETLRDRLRGELLGTVFAGRLEALDAFLARRGGDAALRDLAGWQVRGLARVVASSADAARYLAGRPALLERLAGATPDGLEARAAQLREEILPPYDDLEASLDALRLLRRDETAFAACFDLSDAVGFEAVSRFLSIVAEGCLGWALARAEAAERSEPRGWPALSIVGMGKIAGRELTYHSDLDLVFLYPDPAPSAQQPARIAQRLIVYLSTMTGAGVAYAVDSRLRPSGRQGALVSPYAAFERYQLVRAATWEHLALMRARGIAGEIERTERLLAGVREQLAARAAGTAPWAEIDAMRQRVERERGASLPGAFKLGAGGLMDVEFLAAGGRLEKSAPEALPGVAALLRAHGRGTRLDTLLADYALLRRIEARARWVIGRPVERIDLAGPHGAAVAELVRPGLTPAVLARELDEARGRIRRAYRDVIEAGSVRALCDAPAPSALRTAGPRPA